MKQLGLIEKAFFLKKTALFSTLDLDLLLAIADKTEECLCLSGETLFEKGQDAHHLYIIVEGCVEIISQNKKEFVYPEDFVGDESLFSLLPREYSARCIDKTQLLAISRSHLFEVILESPTVALRALEIYARTYPYRTHTSKNKE